MFKSRQYRAKAAEYGELVKSSASPNERRDFQQLEQRFASLADNEQGLAEDHDSAVLVADQDRPMTRPLPRRKSMSCAVLGPWSSCNGTHYRHLCDGRSSIPPGL